MTSGDKSRSAAPARVPDGTAIAIRPREMIEQHIWNYDFECSSNVIDVYVRRLRRKIDDPFEVKLLETVRGAGYRLHVPDKAER